jgi:rsbT co-antagonist protein RsbR
MENWESFVALKSDLTRLQQRAEESEMRRAELAQELDAARRREALHRSRFEGFMADAPCIMWETWFRPDPSRGRIGYCNEYVKAVLGYEPEEWIRPNFWTTLIHPEDRERMLSDQRLFVEGGGVREWRALARDGRVVWINNIMKVLLDDDGQAAGLRGVTVDVTPLKEVQHERERILRSQQDEIIRAQQAALYELSSPVIPITDEILVVPIIGSLNAERGQQVLDTVLQGSSRSRARVTILDITGVRTVDTQATAALRNTAQALRLLGVTPILTGIRPEVAQALVSLGIGLDHVVTLSTLQSGIQYALRHLTKQRAK